MEEQAGSLQMSFGNFKIARKINLILWVTAALMLAGLTLLLLHTRQDMYAKKAHEARELVRQAIAVIDSQHAQFREGRLSEDEAKRLARETIARMRHGDD